ncbi:MAG: LysR substrate-binding domain-containing protein [Thermodesulfovibrionales bacterium]|nr:LysR substrate-binding domain-containing protein [Thermodesulfovibrionales bacterium]
MEDHKLKAFCLVVELKSFSKAAEAKFVTQSAMSHLIKNLEDETGVKLLIRKGNKILPTPAGKIFYEHAANILMQYKKMESDLYSLMQRVKGPLHIGSTTTAAAWLLPQVFYSFAKNYPDVEIHVSVSNSEDILQRLHKGNLDAGIIENIIRSDAVFSTEIAEDEIVLIASDDNQLAGKHQVTIRDLRDQTFIMPEVGSGIREVIDEFMHALTINTEKLRITMTLGNPELIIQMVQSGMGIAFVSKWSVFKTIKEGSIRLIPLSGKKLLRKFFLVTLEKEPQAMVARTFRDFIKGFRFFAPF